jgi:hypothetical protein
MATDRTGEREACLQAQGMRVIVSPAGGEITVELQEADASHWTGGRIRLSELVGSPPEELAHPEWETRVDAAGVTATIAWRSLRIERRISLHPDAPQLQIEYGFLNAAPIFVRPAFGLRLCIPAPGGVAWHVPAEGSVRSEPFAEGRVKKRYLWPAAPWCGITHGDAGIAALFPEGVLDAVEVRTEGADAPVSLTPLVYYIGLSPGCEARLTCALAVGIALPDGVAELLARQPSPLRAEYGPAPIERRTQAEAAVRRSDAAPSINTEALRIGRTLRERAEQLSAGRTERLELLSRLGRGELSVEEAIVELGQPAAARGRDSEPPERVMNSGAGVEGCDPEELPQ